MSREVTITGSIVQSTRILPYFPGGSGGGSVGEFHISLLLENSALTI